LICIKKRNRTSNRLEKKTVKNAARNLAKAARALPVRWFVVRGFGYRAEQWALSARAALLAGTDGRYGERQASADTRSGDDRANWNCFERRQ
jgi:hypothetical protein